jgi:hypothetical protein
VYNDLANKEEVARHYEKERDDEAKERPGKKELNGDAESVFFRAGVGLQINGLFVERVYVHDAHDAYEVQRFDLGGQGGGNFGGGREVRLKNLQIDGLLLVRGGKGGILG